ncbi:hypothetical protein BDEG_27965 [Batrachochytrium dendrobatidis JEL423]|uniref:Rhamnolipids biosynthesis 3-oxoacyl-[acyl-carrier-protein] reductase n=1 Tax=Batrachochytrium dendrobatidis (strain JEL423) TaxID=403673 RepID=A0A177WZD1_BATDL|nr:hypothetical protein BDEG_27965 [Batrachochytrium dendrobatidis JEL423]
MADFSIQSLFNVKGKVALVTGGGSGIGKMMAAALVQNGCKVYIASRKLKVVQDTASELTLKGPGTCIAIQSNLTTRAQAESLAATIASKESKLHVLINNSGVAWASPLLDYDEKLGWDNLMALNVKGMFYLTAALVPLLKAASNGNVDPARVINISSISAVSPLAEGVLTPNGYGTWSYSVSKAAVNHLTKTLAASLANVFWFREMITVNAIAPGVFPSGMTQYSLSQAENHLVKLQPMGRIGIPDDLAGLALFLSSRASSHMTGVIFTMDGGAILGIPPTRL